ncbi:MAG: TraR/DksA C4-type zinc finger protein [Myxococcaceae bacterium]
MTRFERSIRIRLLARRERLLESIAGSAIRLRSAWATNSEAAGDLREQEVTVQELRGVDRALLRLLQRAYGICERCGRALGTQRLLAEPDAALCSDCAPEAPEARPN